MSVAKSIAVLPLLLLIPACDSDSDGPGPAIPADGGVVDAAFEAGDDGAADAPHDVDPSDAPCEAAPADAQDDGDMQDAPHDGDTQDALDDAPVVDASSDAADANEEPVCTAIPSLRLTQVADGLPGVLLATHAPGDDARMFYVQQGGVIRVAVDGAIEPEPFLDISSLVSTGGERGLLGLAFHPEYVSNGRLWVNYTNTGGDTVVAEYQRSTGDANRVDAGSAQILLTVEQPESNHNGGMIAFGPDGYLYIGMGDGGGGGDPLGHGQDLATQLGSMLRVDVDQYPEPAPGNMVGANVDPHTWAYGLRNPWRFSFDRETGDLYIADVGQGSREEVNFAPAGEGGQNYGWNIMEGTACYPSGSTCDSTGLTLPVLDYDHSLGCSITGGYVYRGQAIPCLRGRYLYGDFCSSRIYSFVGLGEDVVELTDDLDSISLVSGLTSFGEDNHGEVYVCSAYDGRVFRIDAE